MFENFVTGQNLGEWHSGLRATRASAWRPCRGRELDDFVSIGVSHQAAYMKQRLGVFVAGAISGSVIDQLQAFLEYGLSAMWCLGQYVLQRLASRASPCSSEDRDMRFAAAAFALLTAGLGALSAGDSLWVALGRAACPSCSWF